MRIFSVKAFLKRYYAVTIVIFVLLVFYYAIVKSNKDNVVANKEVNYNNKMIVLDRAPNNELLYMGVDQNEEAKNLPSELRYIHIDETKLQKFLEERNSLLIEEPYFSSILTVAKDFDVHPLLLFAILGQEQGFVPRDNVYAKEIANNPFNVFGSWKIYNTNIKDSAEIAARSLIHLSADRPNGEDPIKWINLRGDEGGYAEDETWWIGVKDVFKRLEKETK
jgi:hypothetical protein